MTPSTQFLIDHGLPLVFGAVLLEQLGLPIPAFPWLLAAGALAAAGKASLGAGVLLTAIACLLADVLWFYLGRYRGNQVLSLLCRISLEPDSCIRRTQNVFTKYGLKGVVISKFVPGFSTVAPPLAGMSGISLGRFLVFDGMGSLLYAGSYILAGYFFSRQIEQIAAAFASIGGSALGLLVAVVVAYVTFKFLQRQKILRELRMARITTDELRKKMEDGEDVFVLDLRTSAALKEDPTIIQGAVHLSLEEIETRYHEIPRERDIILYCACPNEVSSARAALLLKRKGFTRVRPLLGGIDAWREQKFPVQSQPSLAPNLVRSKAILSMRLKTDSEPLQQRQVDEPIKTSEANGKV